jgi:UDP-sulfoquinovose synthase
MKIYIIGGDGFCGFPTALKLSNEGHEIKILDNLSRRKIDIELGCSSLTKIYTIYERIDAWEEKTGKIINFELIDISKEFTKLCQLILKDKPDIIIHLGEQRAAPYSMKNSTTSRYTVNNNLNATHNILQAIVHTNRDIHLIHLGTMGVYGYGAVPNVIIPEGYINVEIKNKDQERKELEILHPSYPGSIYHMTKAQDALFFQFYAKNYKLKITDLHQGIIWGINTPETLLDERLTNRFDYDSDYGTVLNRFIMQSSKNIPLTIYGTGEQTRAFINIKNSTECINLAVNNPPNKGDRVKIINQVTETHTLIDLANLIKKIYPQTEINHLRNPRKELDKNSLDVSNKTFLNLGLNPITLNEKEIIFIHDTIKKLESNIDMKHILPKSYWS